MRKLSELAITLDTGRKVTYRGELADNIYTSFKEAVTQGGHPYITFSFQDKEVFHSVRNIVTVEYEKGSETNNAE